LIERISVGSSGQLPRNDRTAEAPRRGARRANPRTGLVSRAVAPRKDPRCPGQFERRTVRTQRGPCVTMRMEPVWVAEPAIERTTPVENRSGRPGPDRMVTILVGRRVATVSFQRAEVVVTSSHSADTVRVTVQSFVSVPVSVTRKAARWGVAASAAPQARRNAAKTEKAPTCRSTIAGTQADEQDEGKFRAVRFVEYCCWACKRLGVVLEGLND
jgi:hypothetical protein